MHELKRWAQQQLRRQVLGRLAHRARPYVRSYGLLQTVKYKPAIVGNPDAGGVLVLAPHMDDEVIGCGGTLCKHLRQGAQVTVVFVTDGRYGSKSLSRYAGAERAQREAEVVATRRREAAAALQALGVQQGIFLDATEGVLAGQPAGNRKLVERVRDVLRLVRPDVVYLPFFLEEHPDHRAMSPLLLQAAAGAGVQDDFDCCAYEVWTPLFPNYLVDISDVVELKKTALSCYRSQLADTDYLHTALGLNAYRSSALLEGGGYVEAFYRASCREYGELYRRLAGADGSPHDLDDINKGKRKGR